MTCEFLAVVCALRRPLLGQSMKHRIYVLTRKVALEFGIIWKEYHGRPFGIRQCSRSVHVDFLELYAQNLEFE